MSRQAFFDSIRRDFYPNGLNQKQVDNINLIISEFEPYNNLHWIAYGLATAYHETGGTLEPIEEYGKGRGRAYGKPAANGNIYHGRGFVQLTWLDNYKTFAGRLDIDLVNQPDLALQADTAARIMSLGMTKGLFTGVSLADFTHADGSLDLIRARRVVNGKDKAALIADYAEKFYDALTAPEPATYTTTPPTPETITPTPAPIPQGHLKRALNSKIVWTQIIGLVSVISSAYGTQLTPEQQATITKLVLIIIAATTMILRTFFSNQPPK